MTADKVQPLHYTLESACACQSSAAPTPCLYLKRRQNYAACCQSHTMTDERGRQRGFKLQYFAWTRACVRAANRIKRWEGKMCIWRCFVLLVFFLLFFSEILINIGISLSFARLNMEIESEEVSLVDLNVSSLLLCAWDKRNRQTRSFMSSAFVAKGRMGSSNFQGKVPEGFFKGRLDEIAHFIWQRLQKRVRKT